MKSLAELQAIKEKVQERIVLPAGSGEIRVVVGMATCGIAAGARPVYDAMVEASKSSDKVKVYQTGCIGICQYEPVMEVYEAGKEKVTYVKMTPEKVARIVAEHLVNGMPVAEYTVGEYLE